MLRTRPTFWMSVAVGVVFFVALVSAVYLTRSTIDSTERFSGIASVYDEDTQTASGQPFDKNAMTAAHRTLPFGTRLKVTFGDRSVFVTVNDRGPFHEDRILDLTSGAAKVLGFDGIERVTVEVQGP